MNNNKKAIYIYIAAGLSIIIPSPARFACGLILLLELNFIMLIATTVKHFMRRIDTGNQAQILLLYLVVCLTVLYKQLLTLFSPVLGLTLSFSVYLVPVSSFTIGYILTESEDYEGSIFTLNLSSSGIFTITALVFYIIREIISFGTISFPWRSGIILVKLPERLLLPPSIFWSTIPGAFVLLSLILAFVTFINRKFEIIRRKE